MISKVFCNPDKLFKNKNKYKLLKDQVVVEVIKIMKHLHVIKNKNICIKKIKMV